MDAGRIVLFLFASAWFYVAAILLVSDWRWNLGRIVQSLCCSGVAAWFIAARRADSFAISVIALLFTLTLLLPLLFQRRALRNVLRGRIPEAQRWHRAAGLLTFSWKRAPTEFVARMLTYVEALTGSAAARRSYLHILSTVLAAPSRRRFLGARIDALISLQQPEAAIKLFESECATGRVKPDAPMLYTLAIPHADLGRLDEAIRLVQKADARRESAAPLDLRRFMAVIRIMAQGGRAATVQRLLREHPRLAALLPPAWPAAYTGLAYVRAGRADAARDSLARAASLLRPLDEPLEHRIQEFYAELESGATAAAVPAEAMDDLERRLFRRPEPDTAVLTEGRPRATIALILACIGVWLFSEAIGSSMDPRTLFHLGANVPDLVRYGQWWRLISSIFLHVGWLHLLFNCYACYLFGRFVEQTTGRRGLFTTFILSGVLGSAASAFLGTHTVSAGASGAVFGLLGASIVIALRLRGVFTAPMRNRYAFNLLFLAAINMVFGLIEPRIDNMAHGGGFAGGILCGIALMAGDGTGVRTASWSVATFLSAALLISAATGTAYNLHTGGYPVRMPPLRRVSHSEQEWHIRVPTFWELERISQTSLVFEDPLGGTLVVGTSPGPPSRVAESPSQSNPVYDQVQAIGPYVFRERIALIPRGREKLARFTYITQHGGRYLTAYFECDARQMKEYAPLIRIIISTWRVPGLPQPEPPETEERFTTA